MAAGVGVDGWTGQHAAVRPRTRTGLRAPVAGAATLVVAGLKAGDVPPAQSAGRILVVAIGRRALAVILTDPFPDGRSIRLLVRRPNPARHGRHARADGQSRPGALIG